VGVAAGAYAIQVDWTILRGSARAEPARVGLGRR